MKLSRLQKYILSKGLEGRQYSVSKSVLSSFYGSLKKKPKIEDQLSIITKSVDRLIKNGLIKGVGVKTAEKWFIKEVVLTKEGIKKARELFGKQQELPLKKRKK